MPGGVGPSFHTLNGLPVEQMSVSFPRNGAWVADCVVQNPTNPLQGLVPTGVPPTVGQPCSLIVDSFTFLGSCIASSQADVGTVRVRVIGGLTGGYARAVVPTNNAVGPTAALAAQTMLAASGEALNPALSNPAIANAVLQGWQTLGGLTLAQSMTRLASSVGCAWRVDYTTGAAYLAVDTFLVPAQLPTNASLTDAPEGVGLDYDCPILDMLPLPGMAAPGGTPINEVVVVTSNDRLHVQLRNQQLGGFLPVPADVAACRLYSGTIALPNPDGTVVVVPDSRAALGPALARVKASTGVPALLLAAQAALAASTTDKPAWSAFITALQAPMLPGTRCVFTFPNGDPSALPMVVAYLPAGP